MENEANKRIEGASQGMVEILSVGLAVRSVIRSPRKNEDKNDAAIVVTGEVRDNLILSIDDSYDSWVRDSGASFHTTSQRDLLENYVAGNHGKVYMANGEPLDVIGIRDARLKMPNGSV